MKTKSSILLKLTIILLLLFALSNIILSFISLFEPVRSNEFEALHNVAMGIYSLLISIISLTTIITGIFLFKLKRWAYILNLILLIFTIPLLGISNLKEIAFQISPGSEISITKEAVPIFILSLLIFSIRSFFGNKKAIHS